MNKEFFKRNKKVFLISLAVVLVGLSFFIKSSSVFKGPSTTERAGLIYNNETLNDLVSQDTDKDGVLDWEESLWGTNPKTPDSDADGIGDAAEIAKMKETSGKTSNSSSGIEEKLTETDKFSRELFTSVTALSQTGGMDQDTVNKLSSSVVDQISNPLITKVFSTTDIQITGDNSPAATKKYSDALDATFKKVPGLFNEGYAGVAYRVGKRFADVMNPYQTEANPDSSILTGLNPVIKDTKALVAGLTKLSVPVPQKFLSAHLDVVNALERLTENMTALTLLESDPIVAMGGASKFPENMDALQAAVTKLKKLIDNSAKN